MRTAACLLALCLPPAFPPPCEGAPLPPPRAAKPCKPAAWPLGRVRRMSVAGIPFCVNFLPWGRYEVCHANGGRLTAGEWRLEGAVIHVEEWQEDGPLRWQIPLQDVKGREVRCGNDVVLYLD